MRKLIYFCVAILSFCLLFISVNAQSKQPYGYSKSYVYKGDSLRRFGGNFSKILYLKNSENLIFTNTSITASQFKHLTQWFKTDKNGNIIQEITDSINNVLNYYINDIKYNFNNESRFFVSGWKDDATNYINSVILENRDTSLNLNWIKEYPLGQDTFVRYTSVQPINYNNIYVSLNAGILDQNNQGKIKKVFAWIWKLDTIGNIIWKKAIDTNENNSIKEIILANDGSLLFYGRTGGYGVPLSTTASGLVIKIDTAGNKLWHKVYHLPLYNGIEKIIPTADGNYICAGWSRISPEINDMSNSAGRILKINEQGNIIWDKIINISPRVESFTSIISTSNNNFIALGDSYKNYAYDIYNYEVGNTREPDGWALKIDLDGNIKWSRVFGHNAIPHAHDYLYNAVPLPDGGFIASGSTQIKDSTWWENGKPIYAQRQAGWVVKLDSMGCLGSGCPEMLADYQDSLNNPQPPIDHITEITLYPNPGKDVATLENKAGFSPGAYYYISDMQGKIVQDKTPIDGQKQVKIDLRGHAAASYIVRVYHDYGYYSFQYAKRE